VSHANVGILFDCLDWLQPLWLGGCFAAALEAAGSAVAFANCSAWKQQVQHP
jgi:hypothetical protein